MTTGRPFSLPILLAALTLLAGVNRSHAFSQITGENGDPSVREGIVSVPLPPVPGQANAPSDTAPATPPAAPKPSDVPAPDAPGAPDPGADPEDGGAAQVPDTGGAAGQATAPDLPPADIAYGDDKLPTPVRDLRRKLIEIAKTGDIEKLRPFLDTGADATTLSLVQTDEDPIETLKGASGDGGGVEILAILLETLEAGYVHVGQDGDDEIYVWPYFTQVNLEKLTKPQLVELFELVTAGDYQRMVGNGSYDFYRVGISPEGRFEFFVAGD